jgi:glycosyltransferase involved in cell wall biosynthesis
VRIAIVHSFYRSDVPSGENAMVTEQVEMLRSAGHDVELLSISTDEASKEPLYSVRAALRTLTGSGPFPSERLTAFAPDIVHVHNLFPNFGTAWLRDVRVPVVATLHNYRPLCANGLLFRDGQTCTQCPDGRASAAVQHGCYHDSALASIPLAVRNSRGLAGNALLTHAAAVVCPSRVCADVFASYGLDRARIRVIPNGVRDSGHRRVTPGNGRWVVVGRLTPEKGIGDLIRSWPPGWELDVIGDGAGVDLPAALPVGVRRLGSVPRADLLRMLPEYAGLIFPSRCLETQGMVVSEAASVGIPVVARRGNAAAGLVEDRGLGLTYETDDELRDALIHVDRDRSELGDRARDAFEQELSDAVWRTRTLTLYDSLVSASA